MKTVVDNRMVVHLWGNQSQETARNSGNSLHFDGPILFSYAEPIARFVEHRGKKAVLMTSRSFSITTSGHSSSVFSAIPDRDTTPVFSVPEICFGRQTVYHEKNWESYLKRLEEAALQAKRCRPENRDWKLRAFGRIAEAAQAYSKFFGLRKRLPSGDITAMADQFATNRGRAEKAEKDRKAKEQKAIESKFKENLDVWLKGGDALQCRIPERHQGKAWLRVKDDELQTSMGARVPLDHATKAFPAIFACKQHGRTWERNGQQIRVGSFQIDRIEPNGDIKAGCHKIEWSEIERIARQLELIPAQA